MPLSSFIGQEQENYSPVSPKFKIVKESGKGVSIQNIRGALTRFKKLGFLTEKATKAGRVISICNWDNYQESETTAQQRIQQRGNKEVTTNKNNKNEKSIGDGVKKKFSPPTRSDISFFIDCHSRKSMFSTNFRVFSFCYKSYRWRLTRPETKLSRFSINKLYF